MASFSPQTKSSESVRGLMKLSVGSREVIGHPRSIPVFGYSLIGHLMMVSAAYLIALTLVLKLA